MVKATTADWREWRATRSPQAAGESRKIKLLLRFFRRSVFPVLLVGPAPDSVLIVVNQSSALSRKIGEYYAERRRIPASNICRLNATTDEEISRSDFDDQIARPIQNYLRGHNLTEQSALHRHHGRSVP
jgi:hypothetical protein